MNLLQELGKKIASKVEEVIGKFSREKEVLPKDESLQGSERAQREKLGKSLEFDPGELLDPRVCKEDKVIPNILRYLGVKEELINHPEFLYMINWIKDIIENEGGCVIKDYHTREEIDSIVKAISNCNIISELSLETAELDTDVGSDGYKKNMECIGSTKRRRGISIDREKKSIMVQTLSVAPNEKGTDTIAEYHFSLDEKGNVVVRNAAKFIKRSGKSQRTKVKTFTINSDGIFLKSEEMIYERSGEDVRANDLFYTLTIRDPEYPLIAYCERNVGGKRTNHYYPINPEALYELGEECDNTGKSIMYGERKDAVEHCNKSAREIYQKMMYGFIGLHIRYRGLNEIAKKAGIIPEDPQR